jgi:N-acetylneuraminic acid mutarotase
VKQPFKRAARHIPAVAAVLTSGAMVLAITAPAQAATTHTAASHAVVSHKTSKSAHPHGRVTRSEAAKAEAKAKSAGLVQAQTGGASDARAVCAAVKIGYSTCMSVIRTNTKHFLGVHPDQTPSGYGPSQLQSAYNLPSSTAGSGQTVAIVDAYDDPDAEADLQVYRAQYGLPVCDTANGCFQKLNQDGQTSPLPPPAGDNGWDVEESLDVDMVSAICPNCHIDLIEANSNSDSDLYTAESAAVATGAKYVSNSWAGDEYSGETTDDTYFNHPGVVITAAAGDYGYGPLYPSASQYVTSVGGTTLTQDSSSPRGWDETAWDGTGSGCSQYEPKPTWQTDTGCSNRTETDVSADADPNTGVALYDSYSVGGWYEVGGTSVATPIIASTYALAGTPVAGTYPASYPYAHTSSLNDVTSGSNGECTPAYLCTAGPGYDGPTGNGTPNGVTAFQGAPSGVLSGQVMSKSGTALSGATVSAGSGYTTTTDSSGDYSMTVPDGTYNVTAEAFGYKTATASGVTISTGDTTTQNFSLKSVPSHTVSGIVTDGSGHRWPLYASISVTGYPGGAVYTDPYTGAYSINLPDDNTYSVTVTPQYPGYNTATASVKVGDANKTQNFKVTVDATTCSAPGYAYKYNGSTETFTGWQNSTPEDGWSVVDNEGNGQTWNFSNPGDYLDPPPGGDADFATVDSLYYGYGYNQDTSLVSPVENLSKDKSPVINFDTYYFGYYSQTADVDLSLDGGNTWTTVWSQTENTVSGPVSIPIPQAAGQSDVEVRFHYVQNEDFGFYWELDNVFIGNQACVPTPGGLVDGVVTDNNTGNPVNGASVTSNSNPGQTGVTAANPNDPNLPNGFYWLFASPGSTQFTAADGNYTPSTQTVDVESNTVTHQDWSLQAGNLAETPGSLSVTQTLGAAKTGKVKFTDTGTEPVQVQLNDQDSGFTPMGVKAGDKAALKGAPLEKIKGRYSTAAMVLQNAKNKAKDKTRSTAHILQVRAGVSAADSPWANIANYPESIMDNAVGYDPDSGNVYSAGGFNGDENVADAFVFSGSSQSWSAIAPLPEALESPTGAFLNGTFYSIGGWDSSGNPSSNAYAYDPSSNSWSQIASLPVAIAAGTTATLNGTLYVIGGCTTGDCSPGSQAVYAYSPSSNSWTQEANYPVTVAFAACAGVDGEIACAGGNDPSDSASLSSTYLWSPSTNSWSQGATMPFDDWAMVYGGSDNMLQIAAGVTDNSEEVTNQAAEYDPSSNSWTTLPNANNAEYRGGGSCGLYQIGGSTGGFSPTPNADVLPGYNQCGSENIPWLSTSSSKFTLNPGQSLTVGVTMDSSQVSQPGTYTAQLGVETNTPYSFSPINITMQANPPSTWSKVMGTVTDASTGDPLAGATIQICTQYSTKTGTCGSVSYTLTTDSNGDYQLWLNRGYNPLQIIAAMANYQPVSKIAKLISGVPTTVNFALNKAG